MLGQRVGEPLLPGSVLKHAIRDALLPAEAEVEEEKEGAGGARGGSGVKYGWLSSEVGEEEGRLMGPTDLETMHAVLFREEPSAVVLMKISDVCVDGKWEQVVREEPIRLLLEAAQERASAQLMPDGGAGNENSTGGLQGEMMATIDARIDSIDPEETDPLILEYTTNLAGFNRPNPHNEAAVAAAAAVEAQLEAAPLSEQIRHKFSQCKMAGVERLGIGTHSESTPYSDFYMIYVLGH